MEEITPLDTIIELKSCSIMQQDHLVLSDVNLKVDKGEFVYLVSPKAKDGWQDSASTR